MNCKPKSRTFSRPRPKPRKSHVTKSGRIILGRKEYRELCALALERAGGYCETPGCRVRVFGRPENFHHIRHRSLGGSDSLDNIRVLCLEHHNREHGR